MSKSERVYDFLRDKITSGDYDPGHRLVFAEIARKMQVSVIPVREAVRQLEAEGFVCFEHNRGARVIMTDGGDYQDTMQVLAIAEGAATALSLPYIDESDLEHAAKINNHMRLLLDDFDAELFTEFNRRFHMVLHSACPNPQLLDFTRQKWERLDMLRNSTFETVPDRAEHSVAEHEQILELIRSKADPVEIEFAVRKHRLATLEAYTEMCNIKRAAAKSSEPAQVIQLNG